MRLSPALVFNILLRLLMLYLLLETLLLPNDPRFVGKAIPVRNFIIVGSLSLVVPLIYFLNKRRKGYPFLLDFVYLSIFTFDMLGNSLNLYDTVWYFDIISHFHGTGAFAAVAYLIVLSRRQKNVIKLSDFELVLYVFAISTLIHVALELQEYYTDVFFGTRNVIGKNADIIQGMADTAHDLVAGFVGSFVYMGLVKVLFSINPMYKRKMLDSIGVLFTRRSFK